MHCAGVSKILWPCLNIPPDPLPGPCTYLHTPPISNSHGAPNNGRNYPNNGI